MKRKLLLVTTILAMSIMTGCGNEATSEPEKDVIVETTEETTEEVTEEATTEEVKRDLVEGDYSEMGDGIAYISTPSGTSEDGNIPVLFVSSDDVLIQIGLRAEEFNGGSLSYIYIDGVLLSKEQLADSQTSLDLEGNNLAIGKHKVEIVQYDNDEPTGTMTTYKPCEYEVKSAD